MKSKMVSPKITQRTVTKLGREPRLLAEHSFPLSEPTYADRAFVLAVKVKKRYGMNYIDH